MSSPLNPFSNGQSQSEARAKQAERNIHQQNFAAGEDPSRDKEYLKEITKEQLDDATYELMLNLFSHDFVLSNLKDEEVTEQKWLARIVAVKTKRMHPDTESFATGLTRQVVFDDTQHGSLKPLSPHQESLVDQAVLQFLTRPPRSRGGWQQDEVSKQYNVSKVEGESDNNTGGSLFG